MSLDRYNEIILAEARKHPVGLNISMACPACRDRKGLATDAPMAEKLYFVREGGAVAVHCFSASCSMSGYIPDNSSVGQFNKTPKTITPRKYIGKLTTLPVEQRRWLASYGLTEEQITTNRFRWCPERQYVHKPIINGLGAPVGEWLKYRGDDPNMPKNMVFKHLDYPMIDFPVGGKSHKLLQSTQVVVEDPISMLKVNQVTESCAILGTGLSTEMVFLLRGLTDRLILFFDADATQKALGYMNNKGHLMPIQVLPSQLGYDPKDLAPGELVNLLSQYKGT